MSAWPQESIAVPRIGPTELLIDGDWVQGSGSPMPTFDPATGERIASVSVAGGDEVERAVRAARAALEKGPWSRMDAADRGRLLYRLADAIEGGKDELAALESYNCGMKIGDARDVVGLVLDSLRYYGGWADKIEGATIPIRHGHFAYTRRQPVGVIAQITPGNFPLLMLAWKWGPALAAGNTIIMKPAEQTPLSALRVGELALEVGFPKGVVNILNGPGESVGDALVRHPGIDKLAFTGHVETAKIIQRNAADTLKRVTFELGGKSPIVVFDDCNLDEAVEGAYSANYRHAGQCCSAGTRVFVHKRIREEFTARLASKVAARRIGHQLDEHTDQGPQISQEQLEKIMSYIDGAQHEGARLVTGGQRVGDKGYFVSPTVFDNVKDDMRIARDEVFGPVASVLEFDDPAGVIDRANDTRFGLAAAVFTRDVNKAVAFADKVNAGYVWVNCYFVMDAAMPFGGMKQSGIGRENGAAALEHHTETKAVIINRGRE
jgi:aldehyde dehydrogenase (NAD+)